MKAVGNPNPLVKTPMYTQRCPERVVDQTLAPRADFRPKRIGVLSLDFLRPGLARGVGIRRALLARHVLAPEHKELEEDVPKPATRTPDVPFIDAAVFLDKSLRYDPLRREVGHVLQELVDHIRDDLEDGQGAEDGICWWGLECLGAPDPERE